MSPPSQTVPAFTSHNILLDNGRYTRSADLPLLEQGGWFVSAKRVLDMVFPGERERIEICDLGCLEGGYATGFARQGFSAFGIEVRDLNFRCCEYVKANTNLPNLSFFQDDVVNIGRYEPFDVAFCCGLLYHLDRPKEFLEELSQKTRRVLILQTHFSLTDGHPSNFSLSALSVNEGLRGRWYTEFSAGASMEQREKKRWHSWQNDASFWVKREDLIGLIYDLGFTCVFEQFDSFAPHITAKLDSEYASALRGTFVGVRV